MEEESNGSDEYRALLDGFCACTGLSPKDEDRESFYRVADIVVDDISMTLMPGPDDQDPQLLYICDFGELPVKNGVLVMVRLLELNHAAFGVAHPSFGLSFVTGHVLLSGAMPVAQIEAEALVAMLKHYASKAKEWRKNWFLSDEEMNLGTRTSDAAKGRRDRNLRMASVTALDRKDER